MQPVDAPEFLASLLPKDETLVAEDKSQFRESLLNLGNRFWQGGWQDGRIGQIKTQIGEIAHACAVFKQDEIKSAYEARLAQLETEIELKKKIYKNAETDYETSDKYHKSINKKYRKNPRKFSKSVAVIYLVFAILLTFADIPLALKLTQTGFDLDLGENFRIQQLFENPWGVFKENWEVFILAFGVALCTISIKIFYDEFIEKPLELTITEFKNLRGVKTPEEVQKIKRVHLYRLAFKILVLFLTLGTVVMLGKFRFETIEHQNRLEERSVGSGLGFDQFSDIAEPDANGASGTDFLSVARQDSSAAQDEETRKTITEWTFIAITILFPLIGGICASLGLNYWGNRRELNVSRKLCETFKAHYLAASKQVEETDKKKSYWRGALDWCTGKAFVSNVQKLLLNYYDHGYQRGMLESDTSNLGKDLFAWAEALRNDLISRNIHQLLQNNGVRNVLAEPETPGKNGKATTDHENIPI